VVKVNAVYCLCVQYDAERKNRATTLCLTSLIEYTGKEENTSVSAVNLLLGQPEPLITNTGENKYLALSRP
jgi:hypothetical protein